MQKINYPSPLLSMEFASQSGEIIPLTFRNPLQVITTEKTEDVLSCMQLVQTAVQKGYYAAGFLSYESASAFHPGLTEKTETSLPLLWFGIFEKADCSRITSENAYTLSDWKPNVPSDEYLSSIESIKNAIEHGVSYQTNYTIQFHSQFVGDDIAYFEQLKRAQSSNYCAYINTGEHSILSASPELFFHLNGNKITTRPMKGTIKRGNTKSEDETNANWLYYSEKNRAENVMIVDLLRNDLGMIAEPGTVKVEKLFEIEHYPTVHQMTSTISATVSSNTDLVDIFRALFPCGSITGAPKKSTMELISELEKAPREVYCGAIGYIAPDGEAIFNVPIRTVQIEHKSGKAIYGVGGGITWDSTVEGEYDEILAKMGLLQQNQPDFQLLESLLLENGRYFLLEEHLGRIKNSANYFGYECNLDDIENALFCLAKQHDDTTYKVRLLVEKNGAIKVEASPLAQTNGPVKVSLANKPLSKNNPFLYHKTTHREIYSDYQQTKPNDCFDLLLWNEEDEITEFTNGNIVLEIDGTKWTPPISSGLLAGTFRESLISMHEIQEKRLTLADLNRAKKIWFINSVRKWLEVIFV